MRTGTMVMAGALAAFVAAAPARAQQQELPRELVSALLSGYGGEDEPRILVGRLPEGFPREAVPAGARVVGGVVHDSGTGMAVLALQKPPAEALAEVERAMVAGGWTRRTLPQQRGFVSTTAASGPLCRDGASASLSCTRGEGGTSYVKVYVHREGMSTCSGSFERMAAMSEDETPMPQLMAPAGVRVQGMGSGSGTGFRETSASVQTALTAGELLAHYGAQLEQAGWTPVAPATDGPIAARMYRSTDAEGRAWLGLFSAVAWPDSERREVQFRVVDPKSQYF